LHDHLYQYDDFEDEYKDKGMSYVRKKRFANPNLNRKSEFPNPNRGGEFLYPNYGRKKVTQVLMSIG